MKIKKKAYAKINLTLEILGTRRADGFHDIASVMLKAKQLYDELCIELTEQGICVECDKDVCAPEENLAFKAAKKYIELYEKKRGEAFGVNIYIKKNIPSGAGLAGGSSDAAVVLDTLYQQKGALSYEEVYNIAVSLGSDVAFCLEAHSCAICEGRGEIITDLPDIEDVQIKFIFPSTPLYTKGIYAEYDTQNQDDYTKSNSKKMAELIIKGADKKEIFSLMCNDFQSICQKRCPEIQEAVRKLESEGFFAQMSGSGSAVFGIK